MSSAMSTDRSEPTSLLLSSFARLASSLLKREDHPISAPDGMDMVAFSAHLCAASRALETALPPSQRLFTDPYAEVLAGPEALVQCRARRQKATNLALPHRPRIAVRTRYFDDFANSALHRFAPSVAQFVSLAAGLETRAYRLSELSMAVSVFEVDSSRVLMRKKSILEQLDQPPVLLAGSRTTVAADLATPTWQSSLQLAGFDRDVKTVWLLEGLLYYLDEDRVTELLREVCQLSAGGSCLCFSVISAFKQDTRRGFGLSKYFKSAMEDPQRILQETGWELDAVDQIGGPNANYGRWELDHPIGPDDWQKEAATIYVSGTKRK